MHDDDIGFSMVCFQIFSLDSAIVPYLYRCWVLSCDDQFGLIVMNVVYQIITYQINQLHLVVHYCENHFLGGQCRVKAELMLSTSIVA